jgi:hypothetical protein
MIELCVKYRDDCVPYTADFKKLIFLSSVFLKPHWHRLSPNSLHWLKKSKTHFQSSLIRTRIVQNGRNHSNNLTTNAGKCSQKICIRFFIPVLLFLTFACAFSGFLPDLMKRWCHKIFSEKYAFLAFVLNFVKIVWRNQLWTLLSLFKITKRQIIILIKAIKICCNLKHLN